MDFILYSFNKYSCRCSFILFCSLASLFKQLIHAYLLLFILYNFLLSPHCKHSFCSFFCSLQSNLRRFYCLYIINILIKWHQFLFSWCHLYYSLFFNKNLGLITLKEISPFVLLQTFPSLSDLLYSLDFPSAFSTISSIVGYNNTSVSKTGTVSIL